MGAIHFRFAEQQDAFSIATLVNSAYRGESSRRGWTTEADLLGGQRTDSDAIIELLQQPYSYVVMGNEEGELLACAHMQMCDGHTVYLGMLSVSPQHQRRGLGSQIMLECERLAHTLWHANRMQMQVIAQRQALIAYYERRGYRETGETRPFPNDPRFGLPKTDSLYLVVLEKSLSV